MKALRQGLLRMPADLGSIKSRDRNQDGEDGMRCVKARNLAAWTAKGHPSR